MQYIIELRRLLMGTKMCLEFHKKNCRNNTLQSILRNTNSVEYNVILRRRTVSLNKTGLNLYDGVNLGHVRSLCIAPVYSTVWVSTWLRAVVDVCVRIVFVQ